jgi:hypothetical protein
MPDRRFWEECAAAGTLLTITLARHIPPPPETRPWLCCFFDTMQDLCKNPDRIGQRRPPVAPEPAE